MFDAFIYTTTTSFAGINSADSSPVYLIEVDQSLVPNLKQHLQRYKLRSKFQMHDVPTSSLQIFSVWPALSKNVSNADSLVIVDPRAPHLGHRLLTSQPPSTELYPVEVYHVRRTLHGVPEGPEE